MDKKRSVIFRFVICVFFVAVIFFTAILNSSEFVGKYSEASAKINYLVLDSIVERIEYALRYGKELDNYYGIDMVFSDMKEYCGTDEYFITDREGRLLYGEKLPDWYYDEAERLIGKVTDESEAAEISSDGEEYSIINDANETSILTVIEKDDNAVGFVGMTYPANNYDALTERWVHGMIIFALIASAFGIVLFLVLYGILMKKPQPADGGSKKLVRRMMSVVLPVLILVNAAVMVYTYFVFVGGYRDIATNAAEHLIAKNAGDLEKLVAQGINYADISNIDEYYNGLTERTEQLDSIIFSDTDTGGTAVRELPADSTGRKAYLSAEISEDYVRKSVNTAILNVLASAVTAVMMASEILLFLIGILVEEKHERRKKGTADGKITREHLEVVRGLSFFFASFRYMSVAFMAVVLAEIYKPVIIFGYNIPYEIVMSLPMSAQVFISMITSYLSGILTERYGWKRIALVGILIMSVGTLASAFASEPIPFILAQMCLGVGLGLAKMGIDIYAVVVCSEQDMSDYTAGSNASIIVGFSCSALTGALMANIFGYSGAYFAMTVMGLIVFVLVYFFGMNIVSLPKKKEEKEKEKKHKKRFDIFFCGYILFMIIPYFFLMMFVDYFFPVYAVKNGVTVDRIGYVMLFYGMATAYLGTAICRKLSKRFMPAAQMVMILLLLGAAVFAFTVFDTAVFAAVIVLLIGIADGIMPSAQFSYLYQLPLSQRIGFSKTLGIEGFFSSLIGAAAPVIFGVIMMMGVKGLEIVAFMVVSAALLFYVLNGGRKVLKQTKTVSVIAVAVASVMIFGIVSKVSAAEDDPDAGKLSIGYCQAESYYEFDFELYYIAKALEQNGEISALPKELHEGSSALAVWDALSKTTSRFYVFKPENFIDTSKNSYVMLDEDEAGIKLGKDIEAGGADVMITMGTAAGLMVKENSDIPYMNFLASDPVASGIVNGDVLSGSSRGWAHVNSGVDVKALSVMQDIFQPKKVGIVYNMDDPEAYIYSSAAAVDEFAANYGWEVVKRSVSDDYDVKYDDYLADMKQAHTELAGEGIDLYILTTSLLEAEDFSDALEPFAEAGIPSFSINSTEDVRYGVASAVEMCDYSGIGAFAAETLDGFRRGESLDTLSQKYETAPFLVLNVDMMHRSGITLPLDVLLSASKIYQKYGG